MIQKTTLVFVFGCVVTFGLALAFILTSVEAKREARLDRQLAAIQSAKTVDDLRPILEEIVRKQRMDYK